MSEVGAILIQVGAQPPVMFTARFTVGTKGTDMAIPDEYISNQHVEFWPTDGGWVAEDMGSTNGTWLNGQKIYGPHRLAKGDKIRVGHTVMIVVPA